MEHNVKNNGNSKKASKSLQSYVPDKPDKKVIEDAMRKIFAGSSALDNSQKCVDRILTLAEGRNDINNGVGYKEKTKATANDELKAVMSGALKKDLTKSSLRAKGVEELKAKNSVPQIVKPLNSQSKEHISAQKKTITHKPPKVSAQNKITNKRDDFTMRVLQKKKH